MRKRRAPKLKLPIWVALGAVAAAAYLASVLAETFTGADLIIAGLVASAIAYMYFVRPKLNVESKLRSALSHHEDALIRRRAQLLHRDTYGNLDDARWTKEIDRFLYGTLWPKLGSLEQKAFAARRAKLANIARAQIDKIAATKSVFREFSEALGPAGFELFCAEELRRNGWDSHVTKGSGDQGADVIAQKRGMRLVVQCKLYSRTVGNKAVQEVVAARAHEGAHAAAVVTNSNFTLPARELAATNGVLLLHYSDLDSLDGLIGV